MAEGHTNGAKALSVVDQVENMVGRRLEELQLDEAKLVAQLDRVRSETEHLLRIHKATNIDVPADYGVEPRY